MTHEELVKVSKPNENGELLHKTAEVVFMAALERLKELHISLDDALAIPTVYVDLASESETRAS